MTVFGPIWLRIPVGAGAGALLALDPLAGPQRRPLLAVLIAVVRTTVFVGKPALAGDWGTDDFAVDRPVVAAAACVTALFVLGLVTAAFELPL